MAITPGMKQRIGFVFLGLILISPWQVEAKGEGQQVLLSRGTLLYDDLKNRGINHLRYLFMPPEVNKAEYERYTEMVKQLSVDCVAPAKGLAFLMNTVTTKLVSRALADSDGELAGIDITTINRPMLKAFLSIKLASDEDISRWSRLRGARNYAASCKSLLRQRDETLAGEFGDTSDPKHQELTNLVHQLKEQDPNRYHMAFLVLENNLNLFLLESFLNLCHRLELDDETREAFASYESLI